jgi:hypothetical protein
MRTRKRVDSVIPAGTMVVVRKMVTRKGKKTATFWDDAKIGWTKDLQSATVMSLRNARLFFEGSLDDKKVDVVPAQIILVPFIQ